LIAPTTDEHRAWTGKDYALLFFAFFPAAILTWGIHEAAHYFMGRALGYDMWISFNQVGLVAGDYDSLLHRNLVSVAGPVITAIQAVLAWWFIRRSDALWAYSLVFLTVWTRALAMFISLTGDANDEARISLSLGLPLWVLPSISVAFMLVFTVLASRSLRVGWKGNLVAYFGASIVTTLIVFSDQFLFFR
jgi:hypothetical protein